jgi:nucleoside-diphosphate-sugar epimerase
VGSVKLAVLGATGQIGRSLALAYAPRHEVTLFARRPDAAAAFAAARGLTVATDSYENFTSQCFDMIVNAVGDGVPGRIRQAGADIFAVTSAFDDLCLAAVERHPETFYVFLSTGAIFGPDYREALAPQPTLRIPLDKVDASQFYPLAKRVAELRHRERSERRIADIRIFGFVSPELDLDSDFLVAQALKATQRGEIFRVTPTDIPRDYIAALDLVDLIDAFVANGGPNGAYDILSAAPISKLRLLDALKSRWGLDYRIDGEGSPGELCPLPPRLSKDRSAEALGFRPSSSSLDNVLRVMETIRGSSPDTMIGRRI